MSKLSDWSRGVLESLLQQWPLVVKAVAMDSNHYMLAEKGRFESKLAHIMNIFYAIVDGMMMCVICVSYNRNPTLETIL